MKKRLLSLALVLMMVCTILPIVSIEADATGIPLYKKAVLDVNLTKIRTVGCQNGGQACACFSLAYCTTILDGSVHYYSEYNLGTSQADAICNWSSGGFLNDCFPSNINDAYRFIYDQIASGNPVVVKVMGSRSSHHYVAVVGVENVTSYDTLTAENFLILDPAVSVFNIENMGIVGYNLKRESGVYQVVRNGTGKTVRLKAIEYICNHNYNNLGVCECGYEFDFNATFNTRSAGYYNVALNGGIYLRMDKPYTASTVKSEKISAGTQVEVLGDVESVRGDAKNPTVDIWYKVSYNGVVGYTHMNNLTWAGYGEQQITCTLTSPAEGALVPQEAYPVIGAVTSKWPLEEVAAYIDDVWYATVPVGNATTLDLRSTAINSNLDFAALSLGNHTLTIKAHDIYHDLETVCTRRFRTVGTADQVPIANCDEVVGKDSGVYIRGWAFDPDTLGESVTIHVYIDGNFAGECTANTSRPDVNDAYGCGDYHGFSATIPYNVSATGSHSVELYALDTVYGKPATFIGTYNVTISGHTHSYSSTVTAEPGCLTDGVRTYTCSGCGDSYTEMIPATGHIYGEKYFAMNGSTPTYRRDCQNCSAYTNLSVSEYSISLPNSVGLYSVYMGEYGLEQYVCFTPSNTGIYQFTGKAVDADTTAKLYDCTGNLLTENDDGGGDYQFQIQYNCQAGEQYILCIDTFRDSYVGEILYEIEWLNRDVWIYLENASGNYDVYLTTKGEEYTIPLDVIPRRFGYNFEGWWNDGVLYQPGDVIVPEDDMLFDAFWWDGEYVFEEGVVSRNLQVELKYPNTGYYMTLYPGSYQSGGVLFVGTYSLDTVIELYDENGNLLASDDDSGGNYQFQLEYILDGSSTYVVYVRPYNSEYTGNISFEVMKGHKVYYDYENLEGDWPFSYGYYSYGTKIAEYIPKKDGYIFLGWSVDSNETVEYQPGDIFYPDRLPVVLSAVWEPEIGHGWQKLNDEWYYYQNGVKTTGWVLDGKSWYYMNTEGVMQTGWLKEGNTWYYLKPSGAMATGWANVGGVYYYFNASGAMQTGWLKSGNTWYYLKSSGAMATGWAQVGGKWYYFNGSGAMVTGWQKVGGVWYYFQSGGAMQTGWLKLGSTWYYFRSSGAMATGSVKIGAKTYRFNTSGACLNP